MKDKDVRREPRQEQEEDCGQCRQWPAETKSPL